MPGLIRGVARTAVIAGTATSVSNRVSRRQAGRWAQQAQAQQQPPETTPTQPPDEDVGNKVALLKELAQLKEQGALSEAEFELEKSKVLGR